MRDPQLVHHRKVINGLREMLEKLSIKTAARPDRSYVTGNKVKLSVNGQEITYIQDASFSISVEGIDPYDIDDGLNN